MIRFRMVRRTAIAVAVAGVIGATSLGTTVANASTTGPLAASATPAAERGVVSTVYTAKDPNAAYAALTNTQKALFQDALAKHLVASSTVVRASTASTTTSVTASVTAAVSGCWYVYMFTYWNLWGIIHVADTWMQLNWCARNGSITSHSLSNVGGSAVAGPVKYDGVVSRPGLNAGWEYRQAVEFEYSAIESGFSVYGYPCMQLRGGATGKYSYRSSCNLN